MFQKALTGFFLLTLLCHSPLRAAPQPAGQTQPLEFVQTADPISYTFQYSSPEEEYLTTLRTTYALDDVVGGKSSDLEKVQTMCTWVHNRWAHNGRNRAKKADPLSILRNAALGQEFQCIEYSIVLSGVLTSLGIPTRTVYLKTADVETRRDGAGHVVAEAWLRDRQKWVMLDGQWDVVPMLNNTPLNAVEFQQALATNAPGLRIETASETKQKGYFNWIEPYLYYFDTVLDSRFGVNAPPSGLMLVPVGAKCPTVFQHDTPIRRMRYTNSVTTFYPNPVEMLIGEGPKPAPHGDGQAN